MNTTNGWLDRVSVASPCPESWDGMQGDDRKRFCGRCRLNVYNLSGMTRPEAEALVTGAKGRLCVRFYRREDGKVLTRDCPVGISALRRRIAALAGKVAALLALAFAGAGCSPGGGGPGRGSSLRRVQPFATILNWLDPAPRTSVMGGIRPTMGTPVPLPPPPALMGEMTLPPAPSRGPEMGDVCVPEKK